MSSKKSKEKKDTEETSVASFLDKELRPLSWEAYIGQEAIKNNLNILLKAAAERGTPPEHVLFYGPPGLGKTTLAHLVARETGRNLKITSGPAIERVGDLASILTNLTAGDILFIDEIHRLNKAIEEVLYPAMESGVLDIIIGKGPSARTIQLELPPFTLLAATTRVAMISSPLRSRFSGGVFRLEFYTEAEIEEILHRSAKIIGVELKGKAAKEIAKRSRFTPRTANYFLKRARDFAQVESKPLDEETVKKALAMLGIDEKGLSPSDKKLLEVMADKFSGGPVGLGTLAAALSEEEATIEEFNEPYLLQLGLIERTTRGRTLTSHGYEHLGKKIPVNLQKKLI
ncbi:Holliday junction branch migration DNA helicase RuvB [Candidatus Parcubacteria bacterium]|nr:Holliday junction branch migration DNA helicase RuvB [Candidatus Parcubacteria bacterium]